MEHEFEPAVESALLAEAILGTQFRLERVTDILTGRVYVKVGRSSVPEYVGPVRIHYILEQRISKGDKPHKLYGKRKIMSVDRLTEQEFAELGG
jgi:hypothetical protein